MLNDRWELSHRPSTLAEQAGERYPHFCRSRSLPAIHKKKRQPWHARIVRRPERGLGQSISGSVSKTHGKPQNRLRLSGHEQNTRTPDLCKTAYPFRSPRQTMHTLSLQNSLVIGDKKRSLHNQPHGKVAFARTRRPEKEDTRTSNIDTSRMNDHVSPRPPGSMATRP
jgi:hypothetical protein